MQKKNCYILNMKSGCEKGYFNIYQNRVGGIMLLMGDNSVELSLKQVEGLKIDVHALNDFDYALFLNRYF